MVRREAGVPVESVCDLVKATDPYPSAIAVLLDHFESDADYPDRVLEGVARALAVPEASEHWYRLRDLYLRAEGPDALQGLAVAVAATATEEHCHNVVGLLQDSSLGSSRILLVEDVLRIGGKSGRKILESLQDDPTLRKEIAAQLCKRGVSAAEKTGNV